MRGFSLIELLWAMVIVAAVSGALFGLMNQAQAALAVQSELPDMQQRLRAAADAMGDDLLVAGGGGFPPIVPYRRGLERPDAPGLFRSDTVSLLHVDGSAPRAQLARATDGSGILAIAASPGCPAADPLCGFQAGMLAVMFDGTGAYDLFEISAVSTDPAALHHVGVPLSTVYPAGATIARAEAATYWLQRDARTNVSQLMKYDGQWTDLPFADNVSELRFEYYADSLTRLDAASLTDGPWLPDPAFAHRFDADLLRVRRVRVAVRARANVAWLHAPIAERGIELEIAPRSGASLP